MYDLTIQDQWAIAAGDPYPQQIALLCQQIRKRWSDAGRRRSDLNLLSTDLGGPDR